MRRHRGGLDLRLGGCRLAKRQTRDVGTGLFKLSGTQTTGRGSCGKREIALILND